MIADTQSTATIKYTKYADVAKNYKYKTATHDDIDAWDSTDFERNGLYEVLEDNDVRRLYFDFDDLHTIDEFDTAFNAMDALMKVFGDYAILGTTTDPNIANTYKLTLTYIDPEDHEARYPNYSQELHDISVHVVFYTTCMRTDEMLEFVTSGKYDIGCTPDTAVYKGVGMRQLLRHPCANKLFQSTKMTCKNKMNAANIPKDCNNSDLLVTCQGDEKLITLDSLYEFRKSYVPEPLHNVDDDESSDDEHIDPENYIVRDTMSRELFDALIEGYKQLPDSVQIHADVMPVDQEITLYPLFSAIFACVNNDTITQEDAINACTDISIEAPLTRNARSRSREQLNKAKKNKDCNGPGVLFKGLQIHSPDYYNTVIKPLIPKRQPVIEAKFDLKDDFSIRHIREGDYQLNGDNEKLDRVRFLSDLKRAMIVIDKGSGIYIFKERDAQNDTMKLEYLNRKDAHNKLKDLKVGTELKQKQYRKNEEHQLVNKNGFDIYNEGKNNKDFYKDSICFYSERPDDFSFFQGYKYEAIQNDSLIEAFNNHILNVWCSGNQEYYNYVQSWFATTIQHPLAKTRIGLVIKGREGTGKNTVTDVWCELLKGYSNANGDISPVAGRFNTALENKKLYVMNEVDSAEASPTVVFNKLKAYITESTMDVEGKGIDVRTGCQNVLNFIILSNEFDPVKISQTDRRYFVLEPSEEHRVDIPYFKALYETMKTGPHNYDTYRKDFMNALMHYYMNYKVEINLEDIPHTTARKMIQECSKDAITAFVEANVIKLSNDGIPVTDCFDMFNEFVSRNNYNSHFKKTTFKARMSAFCKFDKDGQPSKYKGVRTYRLTDAKKKEYTEIAKTAEEEAADKDKQHSISHLTDRVMDSIYDVIAKSGININDDYESHDNIADMIAKALANELAKKKN